MLKPVDAVEIHCSGKCGNYLLSEFSSDGPGYFRRDDVDCWLSANDWYQHNGGEYCDDCYSEYCPNCEADVELVKGEACPECGKVFE